MQKDLLIEKLKDPDQVKAYGRMSSVEQDIYEEVGIKNCLISCQMGISNRLVQWEDASVFHEFSGYREYLIKPEYEPESDPYNKPSPRGNPLLLLFSMSLGSNHPSGGKRTSCPFLRKEDYGKFST
jgi:hypothetical protein